jgi:hypothetical protein
MILFPAIDLKEGHCVRLKQGDMEQAIFNDDPAAQAAAFEAQGFQWLHVVDLDGAFAGKPMNAAAVEAILKRVAFPVQLGGGIRDMKTIEAWLEKGIARSSSARRRQAIPASCARRQRPSRQGRGRHRCPRRLRGRRLGRDLLAGGRRSRQALRGCRRRRDHLHRHRLRRHAQGINWEGTIGLGAGALRSR